MEDAGPAETTAAVSRAEASAATGNVHASADPSRHDAEESGTLPQRARAARERAARERAARLAAVDWDEVRRAYELSNETVPSIRKRFGLSVHDLSGRRRAEGWTARPAIAAPTRLPYRKAVGVEVLELKLNKLLVVGLAMLEKRLADEGMTDQNARMLTELCRAEEIRMRSTRTRTAKARETKKHDAATDFRDDPAWLDAEIDRRLARLAGREAASAEGEDARGAAEISSGLPRGSAD